ncbi:COMM domain-containing protein 10-like [Sycon ciliatum]|uniref:COMM domain-containing protein 10-like n=1 Tax=Sycon ciliatum TaxID=27933 RepID=UPI0020AAD17A|eukprot:scpid89898/ scgid12887/ COMM domain-containing protein 10
MALMFVETPSLKRAVALINNLAPAKFPLLIQRVLQKLHLSNERSFTEEEEEKLQDVFQVEGRDLKLVLETITFFLQQAAYHLCKPSVLSQQLQNVNLSEEKTAVIAKAWQSSAQTVVERLRETSFYPKQLDDVNWRLNLQMSQASKSRMKQPNAIFEFDISSGSKTVDKVQAEFTHEELYDFYKQLETIQGQLDALS